MGNKLIKVGEYTEKFNLATGQSLPCGPIYKSPGLDVHIRKHHPGKEYLSSFIVQVICAPDYIGKNPREPDSVELVKKIKGNVMVCVKLDARYGHFYVASVFDITDGKLNSRVNSGRLKKC